MPRSYSRTERVGQLIQTEIAKLLQDYFHDDSRVLVTVTDVEVSPDYSLAKVFISVLPDEQAAIDSILYQLQQQKKQLRYQLAQVVKLRAMPDLRFCFDESIRTGAHISGILGKIQDE